MAEAFDPDKYLAEKTKQTAFDPDKYLAEKMGAVPTPMAQPTPDLQRQGITKEGLIRSGLGALPTVGGFVGGLAGLATGPGAIGAAGLGASAGEAYKQLGERYFLNEGPKDSLEALKGIGTEGLIGAGSELGGQMIGKAAKAIAPKVAKSLYKWGETLSGIPKTAIETFKKSPEAIEKLVAEEHGNFPNMANKVKEFANDAIKEKKKSLNETISAALKDSTEPIDVSGAIKKLEEVKAPLDPGVPASLKQIEEIDSRISDLKKRSYQVGEKRFIPLNAANQFKQSFMDDAAGSYTKAGKIYNVGTDSQRALKNAASSLRSEINIAEPSIAEANATHARLHELDEAMHKNLLAVDHPEASLMAAGSGGNQRNLNFLNELSDITGKDISGEAKKLGAASYFGNPSLLPAGPQTGAMVARQKMAGNIGSGLGVGLGLMAHSPTAAAGLGYAGKVMGEMAASPAAVAMAIKAINAGEKISPQMASTLQRLAARGLITTTNGVVKATGEQEKSK